MYDYLKPFPMKAIFCGDNNFPFLWVKFFDNCHYYGNNTSIDNDYYIGDWNVSVANSDLLAYIDKLSSGDLAIIDSFNKEADFEALKEIAKRPERNVSFIYRSQDLNVALALSSHCEIPLIMDETCNLYLGNNFGIFLGTMRLAIIRNSEIIEIR